MTKKQEVINSIREACPELKELSFGCEVLVKARNKGQTDFIGKVLRVSNNGFSLHRKYKQSVYLLRESISYEIIGHPPQLENILLAIYKTWGARTVKLDEKGYAEWKAVEKEQILTLLKYYDTRKSVEENLDNPDLCNFLHTLLNNK